MAGTVVEVMVEPGAEVSIGETLVVISAMKMETEVTAPCSGTLRDIMPLSAGDSVGAGQIVATITPSADAQDEAALSDEHSWAPLLEETKLLQALAKERLAPGSEDPGPGVSFARTARRREVPGRLRDRYFARGRP